MSHYFAPSTRKLCNLRVENLTFSTKTRPFWPISVHFRVRKPAGGASVISVPGPSVTPGPDTGIHAPGDPRPVRLARSS